MQAGCDLYVVGRLLGHRSPLMTVEVPAHLSPDVESAAVARLVR